MTLALTVHNGYYTNKKCCHECHYYRQHFTYDKRYQRYEEICQGHCGRPGARPRKPTSTCEKFAEKSNVALTGVPVRHGMV